MPPRTEEQLRRRAKNARRRYTSKRMSSLKQRFPLIPPDVLERATLRQVSTAVRKIGYGQNALSAFSAGECSSSLLSNIYYPKNLKLERIIRSFAHLRPSP